MSGKPFYQHYHEQQKLLKPPYQHRAEAVAAAKGKASYLLWLGFFAVIMTALVVVWGAHQRQWLANLTINDFQLNSSSRMIAIHDAQAQIEHRNTLPIEIEVKYRDGLEAFRVETTLEELGFKYRLTDSFLNGNDLGHITPFFDTGSHGVANAQDGSLQIAELSIDGDTWTRFIEGLQELTAVEATPAQLAWHSTRGWGLQEERLAQEIDLRHADRALEFVTMQLRNGTMPQKMILGARWIASETPMESQFDYGDAGARLAEMTGTPYVFRIGEQNHWLDLNQDPEAIIVNGTEFWLNDDHLRPSFRAMAEEAYQDPSEIRITGKEEVRPGVFKAIIEGEWKAGKRVESEEILEQLRIVVGSALPELPEGEVLTEREVLVKVHDIPARVYSELDEMEYDVLGVGFSEYSLGNKPNRVHNIKTGLNRINHSVIAPGQKMSFNRLNGIIDYEFKTGYAIFGPVAKPSLGGGICQVSTTFYRGLLDMGVPITQRQNHSWDLSYYRKGGYGLDATIFPAVGLDVKAVNDHGSHVYIHAFAKEDQEEAYVYMYGKSDGREVTLTPHQDIEPFYGSKTLKWTQTVEYTDGRVEEHDIVSRYRM